MKVYEFKNKRVNIPKLLSFGFEKCEDGYLYKTRLDTCGFDMEVKVFHDGMVGTAVFDAENGEEYVVHLIEGASGSFVGSVREDYNEVLEDVSRRCFEVDVFKTPQAKSVLAVICEKYDISPDYPFGDEAIVLRRKDNDKWFAVFLKIPAFKIGLSDDGEIEIVNIKLAPSEIESLIDCERFFPVYHMNKKHWITIPFGFGTDTDEILRLTDKSYNLTGR